MKIGNIRERIEETDVDMGFVNKVVRKHYLEGTQRRGRWGIKYEKDTSFF